MDSKSLRRGVFARPGRRRPERFVRLRCEQVDERIAPAQFTPQTALSFPAGTMNNNGCVATADFNKDGRLDAVVTNYGTNENNNDGTTIVQLMGRATPGFNVRSYSTSAGGTSSNVSYVTVADINGDTWLDVLACNGNQQGIGSVSVFKNDANGLGTLTLQNTFPTGGNNACWVGTADFTGDGILDVAVAHFGKTIIDTNGEQNIQGNMITLFQGVAGTFTFNTLGAPLAPTVQGVVTMVPLSLALADFDGDGFVDILATSPGIPEEVGAPYPQGKLYQFKGNGVGGFAAPNQIDTGGVFPINVQVADIDGDLDKDLVIANSGDPGPLQNLTYDWAGDSVAVLRNFSTPGSITFDFAEPQLANLRGPFATAVADFNMDGRADIAAISYGAPEGGFSFNPIDSFVTVFLGSTTVPGEFVTASPAQYDTMTGDAGGQYLAVGNFGGSSAPDLIVVHDNNRVGLLFNDTIPPATAPTVVSVQVNDGADQRAMVRSIKVTFSGLVNFANNNAAAAFTLSRLTGAGGNVGLAAAVTTNGLQTVVTLTFTGTTATDPLSMLGGGQASLADGRYRLSITDGAVTSQAGTALDGDGNGTAGGAYQSPTDTSGGGANQLKLYRLYGDATGNGVVDLTDLAVLRGTFNADTANPAYLSYLDANNSGAVDLSDLIEFRSRFNGDVFLL